MSTDEQEIAALLDQIDAVKKENAKLESQIAGDAGVNGSDGLNFGFIGIGTINSATIRGLLSSEAKEKISSVFLSPRNAAKAAALKQEYGSIITVCGSNQEVVDKSDWLFLATPPKPTISEETYRPLTFQKEQTIVSLIAGIKPDVLADLCAPVTTVVQAFPLPPAEHHASTTVMTPRHEKVEEIMGFLGKTVAVDSFEQAIAIGVMSCSMGDFYQAQQARYQWLIKQGIDVGVATEAVSAYCATFNDASLRARETGHSGFQHLVDEQTPGGMNESVIKELTTQGNYKNIDAALDSVYSKMMG